MNIVSSEQDRLDMILTQMGAEVKSIHGLLCYVRYKLGETEFFYVYNINAKKQYYLQMIKPYPVGAGLFSEPKQIVEYIKKSIKQFQNAYNSSNFETFISANYKLHHFIHDIENLFMEYNIPVEKMNKISARLDELDKAINEIRETSPKL